MLWQEERWWPAEVAPVAWYRIDVYAELPHGVVQIREFLSEGVAQKLLRELETTSAWRAVSGFKPAFQFQPGPHMVHSHTVHLSIHRCTC